MFKKTLIALVIIIFVTNSFVNLPTAEENEPDLKIVNLSYPSTIYENEEIEIVVQIQNIGTKNITAGNIIKVGLFLDYQSTPIKTNSTATGLLKNGKTYVNISWTSTISDNKKHNLSVIVNYDNTISESDLDNNVWDFFAILSEKRTDLKITDINIPSSLDISKKSTIYATIRNNGKTKKGTTFIELRSDKEGLIQKITTNKNLTRNSSYSFTFNWTPDIFGIHKVTLKVYDDNLTYDTIERNIAVGIHKFNWWNENWHYRYYISTTKKNMVYKNLNFTAILDNLNVSSKNFENDTIRIVRYNSDGEVTGVVEDYCFNETSDFDNQSNANGKLIWDASSISGIKYFFVYFDVDANPGIRTTLEENENLTAPSSGNIDSSGIADGWWSIINEPKEIEFNFIDNPIKINVSTVSIANNVSANVFLKENESHNFTLYLSDVGNKTNWLSNDFYFDSEGFWTIRVICNDLAGYEFYINELDFYVGKPDLKLINISFKSNLSEDRLYVDDEINISAKVYCYNASIENATVYLSIEDSNNVTVYNKSTKFDFVKNKNIFVNFFWNTNLSGKYTIDIVVDYGNFVNESNESNNALSRTLNIYEVPDLLVEKITLPDKPVYEFDEVEIEVKIKNIAAGDAIDYPIALFVEKESQGYMKYTAERDREITTVKANSQKSISLFWDDAIAGEWLVGIKILTDDGKRDANILNNRLLSAQILTVKSYEKNPPLIKNLVIQPTDIEQGETVIITADITDETGIKEVNITFKKPDGDITIVDMSRTNENNKFKGIFDDTAVIGTYTFSILAVDSSVHENMAQKNSSFEVNKETQPPIISYFGADPLVQLKNKEVKISCVVTDNIKTEQVKVFITNPTGLLSEHTLSLESDDVYDYTADYDEYGSYSYYIIATDEAENFIKSECKTFWISSNVNDRDNDGIPDWWEDRYGLNPRDPSDATKDLDGDGIKNIDEYKGNINPEKNILLQNVGYRIKNNLDYFGISIVLFIAILFLFMISKRRLS